MSETRPLERSAKSGLRALPAGDARTGGEDARQGILDAAIEALAAGGEASVRVSEVAARAGTAIGLIYYYFGDREGLVQAAQLERFHRLVASDIDKLEAAAVQTDSVEDIAEFIAAIHAEIAGTGRAKSRLDRAAIIGGAYGRDRFAMAIGQAQSEMTRRQGRVIASLQERGIIDAGVDPLAFAAFVQAYALGLVVADIDAQPVDRGALTVVILRALSGVIGGSLGRLLAVQAAALGSRPGPATESVPRARGGRATPRKPRATRAGSRSRG